jgi:putative glutamine amidotransferase
VSLAVGICAATERASWTVWKEVPVTMVPGTYAAAVQRAGGIALLLPPDGAAASDPAPFLDRMDALLLAGGSDIDPASYGAEAQPETGTTWPERDAFELALTRGALDRGMPVLGVCRGMQVLNVALGGTLVQHLDEPMHLHTWGAFSDHDVRLEPGSLAARATGAEKLSVKSHHHQGVDRIGDGLKVTGWSEPGELVEAIELSHRDEYALGVLWHPEEDVESAVIGSLVEAARTGVVSS